MDFRLHPGRYDKNTQEFKTLLAKVSIIDLNNHILAIARVYEKVENLYFHVRLDQITRIYCSPLYLNYQSTDLAKSLLLFSKPGVI
jgi:DNA-directed RNA polymerase